MDPHTHARRRQRNVRILGSFIVAAAAAGALRYALKGNHHSQGAHPHQAQAQGTIPQHKSRPRPGSPSQPTTTRAAVTLAASFQHATHQPVPSDLEAVAVPWAPNQTWAIDPTGITSADNPNPTLWFGEKSGAGPWHWIPSTLPGALNPNLPKPVYQALQLAWDLNQGQPGPNQGGAIQWSAITGHVGMPVGWTMHALSAADSPFGQPAITLLVWMRSYTGTFSGFYGINTLWDVQNAATGRRGLASLTAAPGPLTVIARNTGQS